MAMVNQYNDRRSGPRASPPISFNIHKYKSIPYHYTLLTCVTVVVRTTTVLTRPHTHSLNTTLQKTRRTHRHTHYHKQGTRQSSTIIGCSSREQKERAPKDEVVGGPSPERMHRQAVLAAPRRRPGAARGPPSRRSWRPRPRRRCPRPPCTRSRPPPARSYGQPRHSSPPAHLPQQPAGEQLSVRE